MHRCTTSQQGGISEHFKVDVLELWERLHYLVLQPVHLNRQRCE